MKLSIYVLLEERETWLLDVATSVVPRVDEEMQLNHTPDANHHPIWSKVTRAYYDLGDRFTPVVAVVVVRPSTTADARALVDRMMRVAHAD